MTLLEINTIKECINKVKGAKNIRIGRAADLIWIAMKGIDGEEQVSRREVRRWKRP